MPASDPVNKHGELPANLVTFSRLLRRLGFLVSADQIADLAQSLDYISITEKQDFYHAARSIFAKDPSQIELFSRAFDLFWSGPYEQKTKAILTGQLRSKQRPEEIFSLEAEAAIAQRPSSSQETELKPGVVISARTSYSPAEVLRYKDFSEFDKEELEKSSRLMRQMVIQIKQRLSRRHVRANKRFTQLDLQRSVRQSSRYGYEMLELYWRKRKYKPRRLVVLCDISGSMEQYSRVFLHFMYALVQNSREIESFVFATRLSRITPALRYQEIDSVLTQMAKLVSDWAGGTRIGQSLKSFNFDWGRRVLGQGAVVIIISDGWDRGDIDLLKDEIARLKRSSSQVIWLNPLLGSEDYQPLVRGMQTVLPYVDNFLPAHNLDSLIQLAHSLGEFKFT